MAYLYQYRVFTGLLSIFLWINMNASQTYVYAATEEEGIAFLEANGKKPGVITTSTGLQYKILQHGFGDHHPYPDSPCLCHYEGRLIDGTQFDSSYERGEPTVFSPDQVIRGWSEAMGYMVEGDKFELYVPSDMAYGRRGSPPKIGPDEVLIFTIEMLEIQGDRVPSEKRCPIESLLAGKVDENCPERIVKYVEKLKTKYGDVNDDMEAYHKEWNRLNNMSKTNSAHPELVDWMVTRMNILERIADFKMKEHDEL